MIIYLIVGLINQLVFCAVKLQEIVKDAHHHFPDPEDNLFKD